MRNLGMVRDEENAEDSPTTKKPMGARSEGKLALSRLFVMSKRNHMTTFSLDAISLVLFGLIFRGRIRFTYAWPWNELDWVIQHCKGRLFKHTVYWISLAVTIYHSWMEMNARDFNQEAKDHLTLLSMIEADIRDRLSSWRRVENSQTNWLLCLQWNVYSRILGSREHLSRYAKAYPAKFILGYCSTYIFMQTFMIPGTIFMSLLAGALFGVLKGLFLVVFNATAGASSCYFLSKLIGRPIVSWLWPEKLKYFQTEIAKRKEKLLNYMLFLRITPTLPNLFINLASPIVDIPFHVFFLATAIGLIPASYVTVRHLNAEDFLYLEVELYLGCPSVILWWSIPLVFTSLGVGWGWNCGFLSKLIKDSPGQVGVALALDIDPPRIGQLVGWAGTWDLEVREGQLMLIHDSLFHLFCFAPGGLFGGVSFAEAGSLASLEAGLALGDLKSVKDLYDLKTLSVLFLIGSVAIFPTLLKKKRVYE
ncbi:SNARE associated Golgi protein family [Actinidia rufa]|uniref:SNARE associated Golgi protein family n=1 Tax=Actinidia rufa TaxID=165716 RepID=A0A7J0F9E7_9ERIC|nr:SNARE associated Golgi protein family [Actinidia rufa]